MKPRIKRVYKPLPPHTYEAHPLAHRGEASKPLVIAIIAVVAVVALALLLLFSDQLVGRAYFDPTVSNSAGMELVSLTAPYIYENQPFSLKVKANVAQQTNTISFSVQLLDTVACTNVLGIQSLLPSGWAALENECDITNNVITFTAYSITSGMIGTFDVVQIDFAGLPVSSFSAYFLNFQAYDAANQNMVTSIADPSFEILAAPHCGDGIENDANEQCDDGNGINTDACTVGCMDNVCGDGYQQVGIEQCDDGNVLVESCAYGEFECQFVCGASCQLVPGSTSFCGDGEIDVAHEQCDDSNTDAGDGCSATCQTEVVTPPPAVCGNGVVEVVLGGADEQCDDSNTANGDGCSSTCQNEASATCSDGIKNQAETDVDCGGTCGLCGVGKSCENDLACITNNCNSVTLQCEACTPGESICTSTTNVATCSSTGVNFVNNSWCGTGKSCSNGACVSESPAECGNGVVESGEQCDDSNSVSNDGCSSTCQDEAPVIECTVNTDCASGEVCTANECVVETVPEESLTVTGVKIILTDIETISNTFATKITATETFTTEVTVYTILYGANNKVLSIKSEKLETGLTDGQSYTATVMYPAANVEKKSVLVFDMEQDPSVFGQLQVDQ